MASEAGNELFPCYCYTHYLTVIPMLKKCPQNPFLSAPYKCRSHHSCADVAGGAINLIADHFSAAPGARQRGDVRAGWEEGEVTAEGLKDVKADGSAWLVPRSFRKSSLPWRSWDHKGDVDFWPCHISIVWICEWDRDCASVSPARLGGMDTAGAPGDTMCRSSGDSSADLRLHTS